MTQTETPNTIPELNLPEPNIPPKLNWLQKRALKKQLKRIQKQNKKDEQKLRQDQTTKEWKHDTPKDKQKTIETLGENAFDMYMTKVMMTAVLNRNVKDNHLVNFLKQQNEPQTEEEPTTEQKIKHKIIKDKENKEEDKK